MYVRANIEVTHCTYNTTATNALVGACVNALKNGKVIFTDNSIPNEANVGQAAAIGFQSTNNENGKWVGPVEFTVMNNSRFSYTYVLFNDFIVDPNDHIFTEGSEQFAF